MSYRFNQNFKPLRGYGGTVPSFVYCLYDTAGDAVESLYSRDPLRYGDMTKVCFRSNSFTPPPRVRIPTASVSTCVTDLYGNSIYDLYGDRVCYVPRVKVVAPLAPSVVPQPISPDITPVPVTLPPSSASTSTSFGEGKATFSFDPKTLSEEAMRALVEKYAGSGILITPEVAAKSTTPSADTATSIPATPPPSAAPTATPSQQTTQDASGNNKLVVGGILALLAVGVGVAYLKFRK
jgi:hypothetical protein